MANTAMGNARFITEPGDEHNGPLPNGLSREAPGMRRVLLADHAHETAQRYPVERVDRISVTNAEDSRGEPEAEFRHLDAEPLGRGKVTELVNEDQEAEHRPR